MTKHKIFYKNSPNRDLKLIINFLLFFLLCILNISEVKAGFVTDNSHPFVLVIDKQEAGQKRIVASSADGGLNYFQFGETEQIAKMRVEYEEQLGDKGTFGNTYDKMKFAEFCMNKGLKFGEEIITYPDTVVFREQSGKNGDTYFFRNFNVLAKK